MYKAQYSLRFQASSGGLGTCSPWIRGGLLCMEGLSAIKIIIVVSKYILQFIYIPYILSEIRFKIMNICKCLLYLMNTIKKFIYTYKTYMCVLCVCVYIYLSKICM